jgi:hypothetical protein
MKIKLDTKEIKLYFSYGSGIAMIEIESGVTGIKKIIKETVQIQKEDAVITRMFKSTAVTRIGNSKVNKDYLQNILMHSTNENLSILRSLGCPLGKTISEEIINKLKNAIRKVYEQRQTVHTELEKSEINYEQLADALSQLNQLVLDAMVCIENILIENLKDFKEK